MTNTDRTPSQQAMDENISPEYEWKCITEQAAFAGRDGAGALVFKDQMWLLGGWNPNDKVNFPRICNSEVWCSRDGEEWIEVCEEAPWEGRHTAGYVVCDERMWIVGGDCNQGHYQPDVWSSTDGVAWQQVTDRAPWGQRVLHYTAAFDGKIWVMGGKPYRNLPARRRSFTTMYGTQSTARTGSECRKVRPGRHVV
jgi:hypothetical protein